MFDYKEEKCNVPLTFDVILNHLSERKCIDSYLMNGGEYYGVNRIIMLNGSLKLRLNFVSTQTFDGLPIISLEFVDSNKDYGYAINGLLFPKMHREILNIVMQYFYTGILVHRNRHLIDLLIASYNFINPKLSSICEKSIIKLIERNDSPIDSLDVYAKCYNYISNDFCIDILSNIARNIDKLFTEERIRKFINDSNIHVFHRLILEFCQYKKTPKFARKLLESLLRLLNLLKACYTTEGMAYEENIEQMFKTIKITELKPDYLENVIVDHLFYLPSSDIDRAIMVKTARAYIEKRHTIIYGLFMFTNTQDIVNLYHMDFGFDPDEITFPDNYFIYSGFYYDNHIYGLARISNDFMPVYGLKKYNLLSKKWTNVCEIPFQIHPPFSLSKLDDNVFLTFTLFKNIRNNFAIYSMEDNKWKQYKSFYSDIHKVIVLGSIIFAYVCNEYETSFGIYDLSIKDWECSKYDAALLSIVYLNHRVYALAQDPDQTYKVLETSDLFKNVNFLPPPPLPETSELVSLEGYLFSITKHQNPKPECKTGVYMFDFQCRRWYLFHSLSRDEQDFDISYILPIVLDYTSDSSPNQTMQ